MVVSSRAVVAVGLGLFGLAVLVGPSLGQQQDGGVKRTANSSSTAPQPPAPPTFGTVDMGAIFKGYEKVKSSADEFRAAVVAKKGEMGKIMGEMQQESEMLAKLTPNSPEYKKREDKMTDLKVKGEAMREQAEREFALREAEMLATLYKEVQEMVAAVAKYRGMNYIIRVSNDPVTGSDPNSAMRAIERTVVYADMKNDITNDVVYNLNLRYKAAGGAAPKPAANQTAGTANRPRPN